MSRLDDTAGPAAAGFRDQGARSSGDSADSGDVPYRGLFQYMAEGCAYCRMLFANGEPDDFVYVATNAAFEKLTGLKNVAGRRVSELIPHIREADRELLALYGRVARTQQPEKIEIFVRSLNMWFAVSAYSPEREYFVAIFDVISARKSAEEKLHHSRAMLARTERIAHVGSWEWDAATGVVTWSDEMFRIFGRDISAGPPPIEEYRTHYHPDDLPRLEPALAAARSDGTPYELELRAIRPDGEVRTCVARAFAERSGEGGGVRLFGSFHDITDVKVAEEKRQKLEAQFRHSQKMESVGRLAGGVAHDFNNMLGVILGHADLATVDLPSSHPLREHLDEIRKAAKRSADLTRRLLAFARKQTVVPDVLDLNEMVAGMLKMLKRIIGEEVTLHWVPAAALWLVRIDPSQVDQILANLCVNARDAIATVGTITLSTENRSLSALDCAANAEALPGDYVSLVVRDTGCGMDAATMGHLFEPFYTTKPVGVGTGLGLATVYGIVTQNGGFLDVTSQPGEGTTFRIFLPRHSGEQTRHLVRSEHPAAAPQETILVVEDEPGVLEMTARVLHTLGYMVLRAATPSEAIRIATAHEGALSLLLTDVIMPEMNGHELARAIISLRPTLKVLFTSGYSAEVIPGNDVAKAGMPFIQKPFERHDLALKVREVLDSAPRAPAAVRGN